MKMSPFAFVRRKLGNHVTKTEVRAAIRRVRAKYDPDSISSMSAVRFAMTRGWL